MGGKILIDLTNTSGLPAIGSITTICYLVGLGLKGSKLKDEQIPVIIGFVGAVLGVVASYVMEGYPATNVLDAIAIGIVSGLGAVGIDQIRKQSKKGV